VVAATARLAPALALLALALATPLACARRPPAPPPPAKAEFTPIPEAEAAAVKNPHDHRGKPLCQRCHEPGAAGVKTDPIALCAGCHDVGPMRHPFRVEAPATATDLPLMPGRMIACHTCHEPHAVKARLGGLRMAYKDLCLRCHVRHVTGGRPPATGVHDRHGGGASPEGAEPR
jgi:predicted CXXCH cytochrome family protein